MGLVVEEGWLGVLGELEDGSEVEAELDSGDVFDRPLADSGLGEVMVIFEFGLVIGIADLGTVRWAMFRRARWWGDCIWRTDSYFINCWCQCGEYWVAAGDPCANN